MPRGTARSSGSGGENTSHFNAVRMRLNGTGDLKMILYSLDDVRSQDLTPFVMAASTDIQPTRLANFVQQRAALKGYTTEINEYFRINRIILFQREIWSSYPG